jgi:hypothetical protein
MPLVVKGKRPGIDPERLLDWLANLWVEGTELGTDLRAIEAKIGRQTAWLDANRDHARYGARAMQAWETRKRHEVLMHRMHGLAKDANDLVEKMDAATRQRAVEEIHQWAAIGGPGLEAMAWGLPLDPAWLEEDV